MNDIPHLLNHCVTGIPKYITLVDDEGFESLDMFWKDTRPATYEEVELSLDEAKTAEEFDAGVKVLKCIQVYDEWWRKCADTKT